jgi:predicted Ser/Thr protein kinase
MREIESDPDWGVTSAEAPKFRAEIQAAVNQYIVENGAKDIPYTCHSAVQKCIERFVLKNVRNAARLFASSSARSDEDRQEAVGRQAAPGLPRFHRVVGRGTAA